MDIYVLSCALEKFNHSAYPDCKNAITTVIELYRRGETDVEKFRQAARAAADVAWSVEAGEAARSATWLAARSATWAVARAKPKTK